MGQGPCSVPRFRTMGIGELAPPAVPQTAVAVAATLVVSPNPSTCAKKFSTGLVYVTVTRPEELTSHPVDWVIPPLAAVSPETFIIAFVSARVSGMAVSESRAQAWA